MSTARPTPSRARTVPTADHGEDHGHDDHAHGSEALGPIDWPMWGVGVLGVIVALIVTAGLAAASGFTLAG